MLEYGKEVLGTNPARSLRQLQADLGSLTELDERGDAYISASVDANLLITPINSSYFTFTVLTTWQNVMV